MQGDAVDRVIGVHVVAVEIYEIERAGPPVAVFGCEIESAGDVDVETREDLVRQARRLVVHELGRRAFVRDLVTKFSRADADSDIGSQRRLLAKRVDQVAHDARAGDVVRTAGLDFGAVG